MRFFFVIPTDKMTIIKVLLHFALFAVLLFKQSHAAAVAKKPTFVRPVYTDSYIPAAMQVLYYTVDQLKTLQSIEQGTNSKVGTSSTEAPTTTISGSSAETTRSHLPGQRQPDLKEAQLLAIRANEEGHSEYQEEPSALHQEPPEAHRETPEANYATPETNHEAQYQQEQEDSITVYAAPGYDDFHQHSSNFNNRNDENRFLLLGEKVPQADRPSLMSYLKKANLPLGDSSQLLAMLYDSLSKDAKKFGFSKFHGYSDGVLQTLETSSGGGVGPQLKTILDKVKDSNELTGDDAKMRIDIVLRDLSDQGSSLNTDLRRLLPLRFTH